MYKKTVSITLFFVAAMLFSGEVFQNPSFENDKIEFKLTRMDGPFKKIPPKAEDKRYSSGFDTTRAHSGKRSFFCTATESNGRNYITYSKIPCKPHKEYEFSLWYYLSNQKDVVSVWCNTSFYNAEGKMIGYRNRDHKTSLPNRWHHFRVTEYAPANAVSMNVQVLFIGPQTVWFDDVNFRELPETKYLKTAGILLNKNNEFSLYADKPYFQIPQKGLPEGLKKGGEVTLCAAGNETESFQLVLAPNKDFDALSLSVSDLKNGKNSISANNIKIRRVEFTKNIPAPNPRLEGIHADPLPEYATVKAVKGTNSGYFFTVSVPSGTPKGCYSGNITLANGKDKLVSVPLKVNVYGFSLPEVNLLNTYFFANTSAAYKKLDSRPRKDVLHEVHTLYKEMKLTGNQAYRVTAPKWKNENGHIVVTDWTPFDKSVRQHVKDYGMTSFAIPVLKSIGDNGGWYKSPGRKTTKVWGRRIVGAEPPATPFGGYYDEPVGMGYVIDYAKAFTEHVKKEFPELAFYYYLYDEVRGNNRVLAKIIEQLTAAVPDLKIMLTVDYYGDYMPAYHTKVTPFDGKGLDGNVKNFKNLWLYQWDSSLDPAQTVSARLFGWRLYAANASGALLWQTIYCGGGKYEFNPWKEIGVRHPNACIIYPPYQGKGGVVPSLRLMQIRDGIEDYNILKMLEQKKGRDFVTKLIAPSIPEPLTAVNDPLLMEQIRDKAAKELEK